MMSTRFICFISILISTIIHSLCSTNSTNERTIKDVQTDIQNGIKEKNKNYANLINSAHIKILEDKNFEEIINQQKCGLIAFTVPWCDDSNKLHPIFTEAAELLKDEEFKLFHINPEINTNTAGKHQIIEYPSLKFFKNNEFMEYEFSRNSAKEIATIMKKICGGLITNYESLETIFEDVKKFNKIAVIFSNENSDHYNEEELNKSMNKISGQHNDILIATCYETYVM